MRMSNLHEKVKLKKGPWTREEDQKLLAYIEEHGHGSWRSLPEKARLERCGKSCRLRWTNYLRPDIKRGKFSTQEDKTIIRLHALLGNRWSAIAAHMPKRTDNEIKNYWNTRLKKRLSRMGIDPLTHKPKNDPTGSGSAQSKQAANLNHLTQWETARLEAEERLVRQSKLLWKLRKATVLPPPPPQPRCLDVLKVWEDTTNKNKKGFFDLTKSLDQSSNSSSGDNGHSFMENDAVSINNNYSACGMEEGSSYGQVKGKMENSLQPQENNNMGYSLQECGFNYISGPVNFIPVDDYNCYDTDYMGSSKMVWDFEDKKDHWNELLNLVMSSPMQS